MFCVIPSVIEGSQTVRVDSKMIIFIELNNLSPRFFDCTAFRSEWHDQCHSMYLFCHPERSRGISDYAYWVKTLHYQVWSKYNKVELCIWLEKEKNNRKLRLFLYTHINFAVILLLTCIFKIFFNLFIL